MLGSAVSCDHLESFDAVKLNLNHANRSLSCLKLYLSILSIDTRISTHCIDTEDGSFTAHNNLDKILESILKSLKGQLILIHTYRNGRFSQRKKRATVSSISRSQAQVTCLNLCLRTADGRNCCTLFPVRKSTISIRVDQY